MNVTEGNWLVGQPGPEMIEPGSPKQAPKAFFNPKKPTTHFTLTQDTMSGRPIYLFTGLVVGDDDQIEVIEFADDNDMGIALTSSTGRVTVVTDSKPVAVAFYMRWAGAQ